MDWEAEESGFDSWQSPIYIFAVGSMSALGATRHPPVQWVKGAVSPRVMRQGREPDCSPPHTSSGHSG
jgi:hypothetical protein